MSTLPVTGGCQCGAVRYRLSAPLRWNHFCHCRMCQRATGGVFAALAGAPREALEWTGGQPAVFASSSIAERPFCRDCGTPLGFWYRDSGNVNVTVGSLDDPDAAPVEVHFGIEAKVGWLQLCDGLPERRTGEGASPEGVERLRGMVSHQPGESRP